MGRKILLGFAGPGKTTHTNVKDLLKDYLRLGPERRGRPTLPDAIDEVRVVIPAADDYLTDTVLLLLEWANDYAKFPYEAIYDYETDLNAEILDQSKQEIEARNVGAAMVDRLVEGTKNGDEVALIVAWGEAGDDHTETLVDLAQAKDIKVLDITEGLDDLVFGDPDEAEPEPEPDKPTRRGRRTAKDEQTDEEEKPRPRRGKPRETAETSPEPAEAAETASVEEEVSLARQKAEKTAEATPTAEGDVVMMALLDAQKLSMSLDACHAVMTQTANRQPCELTKLLARAIEVYTEMSSQEPEEEPAKPRGGRPRRDGTPARTRTPAQRGVKEWLNSDGEWVKAGRGRLPKDVKTRTVDPKTGDVLSED